MHPSKDFQSLPLSNDDLDMLKGILDSELEARHIASDSVQADELARTLIGLFQRGITTEAALRQMVRVIATL